MTLSVEEKYALLVKFYCQVKGAVEWIKQSKLPALDVAIFSEDIERYVSEYESAVKELETANVERLGK